jgi:predicted enzyme related to lactoylglutathione lyase
LQARAYSPVKERLVGLECTVTVENVDEIIKRIQNNGGEILMPKTAIPHVGWITKFLDTEGNLVCAMQSDSSARGRTNG